jgi:hypothetical protein
VTDQPPPAEDPSSPIRREPDSRGARKGDADSPHYRSGGGSYGAHSYGYSHLFDVVAFVNAAIAGGVIGNRADAGLVATLRWLLRRRRRPAETTPYGMVRTAEQAIGLAIQAAADQGYPPRRLRYVDISQRSAGLVEIWLVALRITWSRRLLVVRVGSPDPARCEIHPVSLFPLRTGSAYPPRRHDDARPRGRRSR